MKPIPHFFSDSLEYFKEVITGSKCYLEYGSGGSTVYAINEAKVPNLISIESSSKWYSEVKNSLNNLNSNVFLEYCDIGEVKEWGFPKNNSKINNFWQYTIKPWIIAKEQNLNPDLILIDGRFRVSCFLYSLYRSKKHSIILFDDYFDRPKYSIIENFVEIKDKKGNMAVVINNQEYNHINLIDKIIEYSIIPD